VIAAADMEFAAPAGKSSIVMATCRSGAGVVPEIRTSLAMNKAQTTKGNVRAGFMEAILRVGAF
jgi:hypothetical protein